MPPVVAGLLIRHYRGAGAEYRRLIGLMTEFVMGPGRSPANVEAIHAILLRHYQHNDEAYGELTAAVGSFVPGGSPPFRDEVRLAEEFRVFLRRRGINVPDEPRDAETVWPPPPDPNRRPSA